MTVRKLKPEEVEEIKKRKEEIEANGGVFNYSEIGREYGVAGQTIRRNVSPNKNDKKPRVYKPETARAQQKKLRRYKILSLNPAKETDLLIINHLDAQKNKQGYIKKLILKDISELRPETDE